MKKAYVTIIAVLLLVFMMVSTVNAEGIDLTGYTDQELDDLSVAIEADKGRRLNVDSGEISDVPIVVDIPIEEQAFQPIQLQSKGEEVKLLQAKLVVNGFLKGRADGIFGPKTEEALKAMQEEMGREPTGIIETEEDFNEYISVMVGKRDRENTSDLGRYFNVLVDFTENTWNDAQTRAGNLVFAQQADASYELSGTATHAGVIALIPQSIPDTEECIFELPTFMTLHAGEIYLVSGV